MKLTHLLLMLAAVIGGLLVAAAPGAQAQSCNRAVETCS